MSEIPVKHVNALIVSEIEANSPSANAGIQVGDLVRRINDRPILDILDYRFHAAAARMAVEIERDGEPHTLTLRKRIDQDAGLSFEYDLGDKIHTCKNKCVFCFIHQQPKKMRKSLYLMDDDFRLSFMHGNYVTLTNLSHDEWQRILEQRLSPLYVSVHATDPDLRAILLGRREPTAILPQIRELAENQIDVHAQIVLCPGINDGDGLLKTLSELAAEHRAITGKRAGVQSVAIVPVGMTRFRERLPNLTHVERDYAREMITKVRRIEREFSKQLGTRFAWLADEWYHIAELSYPGKSHYEEFPQLEDGIGTMRLFKEGAASVSRRLPGSMPVPVSATLVTAEMPARVIEEFAERLNQIQNVDINVCVVTNNFFGGDIHIAGLLTSQDILAQLNTFKRRHETIYIPRICLRDDYLFLDDVTLDGAREISGFDLRSVGNTPQDLAETLGLIRARRAEAVRSRWIVEEIAS